MKSEIPIFVIFRALGCETDREIVNHILKVEETSYTRQIVDAIEK